MLVKRGQIWREIRFYQYFDGTFSMFYPLSPQSISNKKDQHLCVSKADANEIALHSPRFYQRYELPGWDESETIPQTTAMTSTYFGSWCIIKNRIQHNYLQCIAMRLRICFTLDDILRHTLRVAGTVRLLNNSLSRVNRRLLRLLVSFLRAKHPEQLINICRLPTYCRERASAVFNRVNFK